MIYDHIVQDSQGKDLSLKDYQGKVLLIVNTASKCGFTKQYAGLQDLYEKYRDRGFEILAFPCNQFGHQEPGTNQEIQNFCTDLFSVTFPVMGKIDVNGEGESPLYTDLKKSQGGLLGSAIKWNFTKFLVDRQGRVVGRFAPTTKPQDLEEDIEKIL
ncbi:Glutathione peroxidase homolog BsaA [Urinicoccus massiliensis]|uniref:Glutathione peroxidase n=1 Tax=Urinicoccus massiliensis TaxID=1723382 RepID=A0A8H2M5Q4_9FIRM|nr:glutathione peroxidase [Urinicoccus massiliensis]VFB16909.1 Glutathione peroxidase homolog BsaA [Urinicoccus massiliensis]